MAWPRNQYPQHPYYPPHSAGPYVPPNWAYPAQQQQQMRDVVVGRVNKYAELNPVLEYHQTTIRIDLRVNPRTNHLCADAYQYHATIPASKNTPSNHASRMRLMSPNFPWQIEFSAPHHQPLTCSVVWDALYDCFQQKICDSEWGFICEDKKHREAIEKTAKKRCDAGDDEPAIKRIDYLGDSVWFSGLDKDDDFAKVRLLPGTDAWPETWIVHTQR